MYKVQFSLIYIYYCILQQTTELSCIIMSKICLSAILWAFHRKRSKRDFSLIQRVTGSNLASFGRSLELKRQCYDLKKEDRVQSVRIAESSHSLDFIAQFARFTLDFIAQFARFTYLCWLWSQSADSQRKILDRIECSVNWNRPPERKLQISGLG